MTYLQFLLVVHVLGAVIGFGSTFAFAFFPADADALEPGETGDPAASPAAADEEGWVAASGVSEPMRDDSLVTAKAHLNDSVEELLDVIRNPEVLAAIGSVDRSNLAKYLTIAKPRLENAIAVVRSGDSDR